MNQELPRAARIGRRVTGASVLTSTVVTGVLVVLEGFEPVADSFVTLTALFGVGIGVLGFMLLPLNSGNRVVWVFVGTSVSAALAVSGIALAWLVAVLARPGLGLEELANLSPSEMPSWAWVGAFLSSLFFLPVFSLVSTMGLALFPDGKPPSPRWRWLVWMSYIAIVGSSVGFALSTGPRSTDPLTVEPGQHRGVMGDITAVLTSLVVISMIFSVASLVARYRKSRGEVRQQIRWIAVAAPILFFTIMISSEESPWPLALGAATLIAAYAIAITKYKVYAVDVVISRLVTYGSLAVLIAVLYAVSIFAVIISIGDSNQRPGEGDLGLMLPLFATFLVTLAIEPLRFRLRRWANRLVYGKRAAPHDVLSRLAGQLGDASAGGDLGGLAELLREGTAADSAVVWLMVGDTMRAEAAAPAQALPSIDLSAEEAAIDTEMKLVVPVTFGDEVLGALQIDKSRARVVNDADRQLLGDVAAGVALLFRNMRLNVELDARARELQESRRRLIAAHDSVRHRLERNLHDGAQQQVVALKVKLGLAETIARREEAEDVAIRIGALADQTQEAVDSMRLVARGIYPPLLETEGLAAALGAVGVTVGIGVGLTADEVPRLDRQIEETAYFCVLAALGAARDAGASSGAIALAASPTALHIEVLSDVGLDEVPSAVADRVDAHAGSVEAGSTADGTSLSISLPAVVAVAQ